MITIEKDGLLAAIKKVIPGVEKGLSSDNGAEQLLFTGTSVHSCNGIVSVSAPCDTQGLEFSVKGLDFYKLVERLNGPELSFEIAGNAVKVKGGRTRAKLPLLNPDKLKAYLENVASASVTFKPCPEKFVPAVRVSIISGNVANLRGVAVTEYLGGSAVVATDSKRICFSSIPEKMDSFLVDDAVILDALKCGDPDGYAVVGPWFHLHFPDGTIFSARRKDHSVYPFTAVKNSVGVAETTDPELVGKLPADIKAAVERVAVLASGIDGNNASLIRMTFNAEGLELYATKDGSEATEEIPWDTKPSKDPAGVSVWVNVEFLEDAVNRSVDFSLVHGPRCAFLVFKTDDYMHLVSTNAGTK